MSLRWLPFKLPLNRSLQPVLDYAICPLDFLAKAQWRWKFVGCDHFFKGTLTDVQAFDDLRFGDESDFF